MTQMIRTETPQYCVKCSRNQTHDSVIYPDAEYHTCKVCGTKLEEEYEKNTQTKGTTRFKKAPPPKKMGRKTKGWLR